MSSDEAAAWSGGPERGAASGVAAQTTGAGPGHLQVHQYLRDPWVLHTTRGGQWWLRPHSDMSRRTDVLCHSGGHITDPRGSPHIRGKGNVKHLECGGNTEEHLEKRWFNSRALAVQIGTPTTSTEERGQTVPRTEKRGVQAAEEAQGAETKSWVRRCRELQRDATCRRQPPATAPHHAGSHSWKISIVFKVSVHTLCTDCALNFLTYFIHKQLCICK